MSVIIKSQETKYLAGATFGRPQAKKAHDGTPFHTIITIILKLWNTVFQTKSYSSLLYFARVLAILSSLLFMRLRRDEEY